MRYQLTVKEISLLNAVMGGRIPDFIYSDEDDYGRYDTPEIIQSELKLFHGRHREWLDYDFAGKPVFDADFRKTMMLCFNAELEFSLGSKEDECLYGNSGQFMSIKNHGPDTYYLEYFTTTEESQMNFFRYLGVRYQQNKFPFHPFRLALSKDQYDQLVKWHAKGKLKKIEKLCLKRSKNYDICLQILNDLQDISCLAIDSSNLKISQNIMAVVFLDPMGLVRLSKQIKSGAQDQVILMQAETIQLPQIMSNFEGIPTPIKRKSSALKTVFYIFVSFLILIGLLKYVASQDNEEDSPISPKAPPAINKTTQDLIAIKEKLAAANQKILYPSQLGNYELFSEEVSYSKGSTTTDLEIKYAFVNSKPSTPEYIHYSCRKSTYPFNAKADNLIDVELANGIIGHMDKGNYLTFDKDDFQCSLDPYKSSKEDVIAFAKTLTDKARMIKSTIDLNRVTILKLPKGFTTDSYSTISFTNWYNIYEKETETTSELRINQNETSSLLSFAYTISDKLRYELSKDNVSKQKSIDEIEVYTLKSKEVIFEKNNLNYILNANPDLDLMKIIRSSI